MGSSITNTNQSIDVKPSTETDESAAKKKSVWKTLPAVLTAMAAVIGSLTALITSLSSMPFFSEKPASEQALTAIVPEDLTRGIWFSEKGFYVNSAADFKFNIDGDYIVGIYNNPGADAQIYQGSVSYDLSGNMIVNAYWTENGSIQKCDETKNKTYYWGHLKLTFTSKTTMVGRWGYCNQEPANSFAAVRK